MGFHCIDDSGVLLVLAAQIRTELYVGTFHLMVDGFSDIMQKTCTLGCLDIESEFCGHKTGELCYLDGMLKDVLTVAGTISHTS